MIGPLFWGSHGGLIIHTLSAAVIAMTVASMIDYGRAALTPPPAADPTDQ
jgi:hypothetical protein